MKFIKSLGQVGNTTYYQYQFTKHNTNDVCIGDQVWSDGELVEVYDLAEEDVVDELLGFVSNPTAFVAALEADGVL